jgi:mannose-6-phosphate isomerase-like protein (cupin superfamily)
VSPTSHPARASTTSGGRPAGSPSKRAAPRPATRSRSSRPKTRAGAGLPRHLHHDEDETFFILEGEVTALVSEERIDLGAGDYLFAPRRIAHSYVVGSERARMLVTLSPAGVVDLFVNLGTPVTSAEPPTDPVMPPMDEPVRLFGDYGCELLGPPLSLNDLS